MGIFSFKIITCEICRQGYGETAIFSVYHHGYLGGHTVCVECYPKINDIECSKTFKDIKNKIYKKCDCCGHKNVNKLSRRIFKIHWFGKLDGRIMCEKCVYDKEYRRSR